MAAKRRRRRKKDGGGIRREEGRSFGHEKHEETRKGGIGRSEVRRITAKRRKRRRKDGGVFFATFVTFCG